MPRLSKIGAAALAAFGWTSGSAVSASYLVVAGGGAGGSYVGGGGGAGGLLTGTAALNPTLTYTITIGAGAPAIVASATGSNGGNSTFSAIATTALGGGYGSSGGGTNSPIINPSIGGSGGGGASSGSGATSMQTGAAGTSGQGFAGGSTFTGAANYPSAGGGGAGAVGQSPANTSANGGNGGIGASSSISGTSTYYAGGGGGGASATAGSGGNGGGGAGGSYNSSTNGTNGTANTGGGGGGGGNGSGPTGGAGGSGIVIISYVGAQQFSGGVVTSSGGNTIHTFTTSGTLGPVTPLSANYLVVAGGGGGGGAVNDYTVGGGGGAGGLLSGSSVTIDPYSSYVVTVGAGGTGGLYSALGTNGGNSAWSVVATTALGGGAGGAIASAVAASGGSGGGGGSAPSPAGGAGTSGQGNNGGAGVVHVGGRAAEAGGGGGGAGAVGSAGSSSTGGAGGVGTSSSISGTATYYAGGGGGGGSSVAGAGGNGGGGAGVVYNGNGVDGTAFTGGGGGGAARNNSAGTQTGGNGGSGVVIISYAGSTQLMAGGVVTIAGGNVIHTFNSSGYLTPLTLLTRSLRFRSSASAYLARTPASAGNRQKFTFSYWAKRGTLSVAQEMYFMNAGGGTFSQFSFTAGNAITFASVTSSTADIDLTTTALYRDPASWYHIVLSVDTTQATNTNRVLLYVNGVVQAMSGTYPAQNYNCQLNTTTAQNIGRPTTGTFDGYMAEYNFIDGQALAPTAFGTVNSYGVWQPITYGGSYGTNGFRLPFTNNASTTTLGYDFSPQGNNWTTNNISVTAGSTYDSMTDVPTLTSATAANYCVLNAVNYSTGTVSNGNLQWASTAAAGNGCFSTIAFDIASSTNLYYWEFTLSSGDTTLGIAPTTIAPSNTSRPGSYSYYNANGNKYSGTSFSSYGSSYTAGDIIGVAVGNGSITFYKNGTSQGVAFSSLTGTFTPAIWEVSCTVIANFGQRPFAYTPPTGYLALNTFNL